VYCSVRQYSWSCSICTVVLGSFLNLSLLGFYAAYSGSLLPTFRDKFSVPCSRAKQSSTPEIVRFSLFLYNVCAGALFCV